MTNSARVKINPMGDGSYTTDLEILDECGGVIAVLNCTTEDVAWNLRNIISNSVNGAYDPRTGLLEEAA